MQSKLLISTMLMMSATATYAADSFSEDFEYGDMPEDWTLLEQDESSKATFTVAEYASLADFTSRISKLDECGEFALVAYTGGYSTMGKVYPNLRLKSPQFTVPEGGVVSFYYSYNLAYNNASNLDEAYKTIFDVAVMTGDDASQADVVFTDVSAGLGAWRRVCIDLSKYAGKTVSLLFHNYNNEMSTTLGSMLSQRLYIDNVKVNTDTFSDLCLTSVATFASGAMNQQPATATIRNYGMPVSNFTVSYTIDDNATVTETVDKEIKSNEVLTYTFTQPAKFANSGSQTVAFSVASDADNFTSNNALTTTANIFPLGSLPYPATDSSLSTDFTSTFSGSTRVPGGWKYYSNLSSWVYTGSAYKAYLYTNKAYTLESGKYTVSFDYTSTSSTANAEVYLFKSVGDYLEPVATRLLSQNVETTQNASLSFNVDEAGDYLIAISMEDMQTSEQVAATNIAIKVADPAPDIAVTEVRTPQSNIAAGSYSVSVKLANHGGVAAENVSVSYIFDEQDAISATVASIGAGDEVTFTFPDKLTIDKEPGEYNLTITATAANDDIESNNTLVQTLTVYTPLSMPWAETFTDDNKTAQWTVVNTDEDSAYWGVTDAYQWYDRNVMLLNAFNGAVHNDWLISPALNINEAKARVSFYYGNLNNSEATSHLKVYLAKSTDVADILANGTLVKDIAVAPTQMSYFSEVVEPSEVGTYYIAILGCEGSEAMYLTDVRLDTKTELYVTSCSISETEPTTNQPVKVTMHLINSGFEDLSNVSVSYSAETECDCMPITADETLASLPANSEMDYTFTTDLIFDNANDFTIVCVASHASDADTFNNYAECSAVVYEALSLPYEMGFESATNQLTLNGKWELSSLSPYAGNAALALTGKSADQTDGDWAFLDKVSIPAGTYDLSFFWRTFPGSTGANYHRAFSVCLGNASNAEAMTATLFTTDDALNATEFATKELVPVTIEHDGTYVIGIHCLSAKAQGRLTLDDFKLAKEDEGLSVGAGDEAYEPAINQGWYHYHPVGAISQWAENTTINTPNMEVSEYSDWSGSLKASYLAAPALRLEAGKKYAVTFGYEVLPYTAPSDAPAHAESTDDSSNKLELFVSTQDLPSSYQLFADTSNGNNGIVTAEFTPEATSNYYFAFRPNSATDATYRLLSFKVEENNSSAVELLKENAANATYTINGNTIVPAYGSTVVIYNLLGQKVAATNKPITLPGGIYVINNHKVAF